MLNKLNVFPYRISFVEKFKSIAFVGLFETSLVALPRRHAESSTQGHGFIRLCPGDTKLVRTVHSLASELGIEFFNVTAARTVCKVYKRRSRYHILLPFAWCS